MVDAIRIIIVSWGRCNWLIKPILRLLRRRWIGEIPPVTLITDGPPDDLPGGVDVYDLSGRWETRLYSDRLRDVLKEMSEPVAFVYNIDRYLLNDVHGVDVQLVADYMIATGNVVGCCLSEHSALKDHMEHVTTLDRGIEIVRCTDVRHCGLISGVFIGCALFNKDLLYNLLEPFWTIWKVEEYGTRHLIERNPNLISVAVYPAIFQTVDLSRTDKTYNISGFRNLGLLPEADRSALLKEAPDWVVWD